MSTCPTTDRLRSLLDGKLADAEQSELQRHIDGCESCQRTLESLVAGKESWDGVARQLGDTGEPVTPALHDAMADAVKFGQSAVDATMPSVRLPPGFLQPSELPDSMGRLAHYEILQEVGSGGMGIVLKAFDTSLRRVVAIKVMAPHLAANAAARRRFVREAQAAAAVAHEHVVAIHAVADQHEPPYLAMQFIEGKTLQERLDKSGPLSVREVLRIGIQTAAGLAAAHAQGLVHRDIKPANILLENGVERVKLTDFGLARAVDDASVTQSGVIAGTPLFMSPEQARGEAVDHRSDLFSLGSLLYAMCVGHAPFRASTTMGVIKRVCDESPRPIRELNPDVPDWLVKIIDKLLVKNAADRFGSAKEVAELLGQCLAHLQQPAAVSLPEKLVSRSSRTERLTPPPAAHAPIAAPSVARIGVLHTTRGKFIFGLGLLAGLLTLGWLVQGVSRPVPGPAGAFFTFACELGLLLVAAIGLLAGIVIGSRRFIRGLDTTTPGGRLWGTALSGALLAIASTALLVVPGAVAVYWQSRSVPRKVSVSKTPAEPATESSVAVQLVHSLALGDGAFSLVASPDGKCLAAVGKQGSYSGFAKIWDTQSFESSVSIQQKTGIRRVAFTPSNDQLVVAQDDDLTRLFDLASGKYVGDFNTFGDGPFCVAVSPDGSRVATGGKSGRLSISVLKTFKIDKYLTGTSGDIRSVAFSPDGTRLASGGLDKAVRVWNVETGKLLFVYAQALDRIEQVAFSPDGASLAAASWDKIVWICDATTGEDAGALRGHTEKLTSLAWSPDGKLIATGCFDGTMLVFNRETGHIVARADAKQNQVFGVAFLHNERLASAHRNGVVNVWQLRP